MTKISVGPIRFRRLVWSVLPLLGVFSGSDAWLAGWTLVAIGAACGVRLMLTGVELHDGVITVVNFLRTIRLPLSVVQAAGFASPRLPGFAVPLVLVGDGLVVRASGVSVWTRALPWADQRLVRGRHGLDRVQEFCQRAGISFDPSEPLRASPTV